MFSKPECPPTEWGNEQDKSKPGSKIKHYDSQVLKLVNIIS